MPIALVAAGLSAVGTVASAAISSRASSKAVRAQQDATTQNNALQRENYARNETNLGGAIQRGNTAGGYIADLLGTGGDPAKANAAFDTFRGSSGYQFDLSQGLGAVNSNAYARGMGDSGATLKALQQRGMQIADGSVQNYIGNLRGLDQSGVSAASALAGVGTNMTNQMSGNNQNVADARSNAALSNGANTSSAIQSLLNAGAVAYGSSYGGMKPQQAANPQQGGGNGGYGYSTPYYQTPYGRMPGGFGKYA